MTSPWFQSIPARSTDNTNGINRDSNRGFTLIEVLLVLSIIAILASLSMPILTVVGRSARISATRAVMHKLDTALHLFRGDIGAFPYQRAYADTSLGEIPDNRLGFHLGRRLTPTEIRNLHQDADTAAAQYAYDCTNPGGKPRENAPVSVHAFRISDISPAWNYVKIAPAVFAWRPINARDDHKMATCVMLNRMGAERARLAVWSGAIDITGCRIADSVSPDGVLHSAGRDQTGDELLAAPAVKVTDAQPGWADDYLAGELEARYRNGDSVLDAWGRPIIYICQVIEGVKSSRAVIFHETMGEIDARIYGLTGQSRRTLAPIDPITGAAITADGAFLPDPTKLFASDRRRWAAVGHERGFELWSAGPDRRFEWMRSAGANVDNISLLPYDLEIPR